MNHPTTAEIHATIRDFIHHGNSPAVRTEALVKMLRWRAAASEARDPTFEALYHYTVRDSKDLALILTIAEASDLILFDAAFQHYVVEGHKVTYDLLTPVAVCEAIKRIAVGESSATWHARKLATSIRIGWLKGHEAVQRDCALAFRENPAAHEWVVQAFITEVSKLTDDATFIGANSALDLADDIVGKQRKGRDAPPGLPFRMACACLNDVADSDLPVLQGLLALIPEADQPGHLAELAEHALRTHKQAFWEAAVEGLIHFATDESHGGSYRVRAAHYAIIAARRAELDGAPGTKGPGRLWPWDKLLDRVEVLHNTEPFRDTLRLELRKAGRLKGAS